MLKKLLYVFLAAAVFIMAFTGCVKDGVSQQKTAVYALAGPEPSSIDPAMNNTVSGGIYISHAFEGLTKPDENGNAVPGMAKSWKINDDATVYTFNIRKDAKWSDGEPVTAYDFEYAWKRVAKPETASRYAYQMYYIKNAAKYNAKEATADQMGVKALDDHTLEITLELPATYFLDLTFFYCFMPVRKDIIEQYGEQWTQSPETYISNGPYIMTEWAHDSEIVFKKNGNYWDKGSIDIEEIHWKLMENDTAAVNAYESGELDINFGVIPPDDLVRLEKEGDLLNFAMLGTYFYDFNVEKEPLNDAKVRKALSYAIDRDYIVRHAAGGGQIAACSYVPPNIPGKTYDTDFREEGETYFEKTANIKEAKKLLAEAGYPDGKNFPELEVLYNTGDRHKRIAEAIQEMWKDNLGINVRISNMEWKALMQKKFSGDFSISRSGWTGDYVDPMTFLDMWMTESGNNTINWGNEWYDTLIKKAKESTDRNIRMEAMHEAEDILMDEMPVMPIFYYNTNMLVNPRIKGIYVSPLGGFYLHNAYIENKTG